MHDMIGCPGCGAALVYEQGRLAFFERCRCSDLREMKQRIRQKMQEHLDRLDGLDQ